MNTDHGAFCLLRFPFSPNVKGKAVAQVGVESAGKKKKGEKEKEKRRGETASLH